MRYNEARDLLSYYGLYLHSLSTVLPGGDQRVGSQSVQPGLCVSHGTVIEVSLVTDDKEMLGKY